MGSQQVEKVNRVLSRLSEMRSTMQEDEQAILDGIILNAQLDEVLLHGMTSSKASSKSYNSDLDERAAYGATSKAASRSAKDDEGEVTAHSLVSGPDEVRYTATSKAASRSARLELDPDTKNYKLAS